MRATGGLDGQTSRLTPTERMKTFARGSSLKTTVGRLHISFRSSVFSTPLDWRGVRRPRVMSPSFRLGISVELRGDASGWSCVTKTPKSLTSTDRSRRRTPLSFCCLLNTARYLELFEHVNARGWFSKSNEANVADISSVAGVLNL